MSRPKLLAYRISQGALREVMIFSKPLLRPYRVSQRVRRCDEDWAQSPGPVAYRRGCGGGEDYQLPGVQRGIARSFGRVTTLGLPRGLIAYRREP